MARLVIVSNRVPAFKTRGAASGGLATALKDATARRETLWFGWSGRTSAETSNAAQIATQGRMSLATIDIAAADLRPFYDGFSNGTLWPLLHSRVGLIHFAREELAGYLRVNAAFAAALLPLLRPDDLVWVHDFHLLPLGRMLRDAGAAQRLGFFLHVPFPPPGLFDALPQGAGLLLDLARFDLIGLQTPQDADNLRAAMPAMQHSPLIAAFPIGIDAEGFARLAARAVAGAETRRLHESLGGRPLILGADRLDYTKGLPERFRGYAALLRGMPRHRRNVTFLQLAPVSRGDGVQYRALRRELDELAGRVNGEYGDIDWMPLRWHTRGVPRPTLAGLLRIARVGLVTPLKDGMNLVAKEFVAAQDPQDPGVLVLSRFAGAAVELEGALLVNPHDPDEIAEALDRALAMPLAERVARWQGDMARVRAGHAAGWATGFLDALVSAVPMG